MNHNLFLMSGSTLSDHSTQVMGLSQRWPQLFNRGGHFIEVKITVIEGKIFWNFETDHLKQVHHLKEYHLKHV